MDWQALMPQTGKTETGSGSAGAEGGSPGQSGGVGDPDLFPPVPNSKCICTHSLPSENNVVPNVPNVPTKKAGNPLSGGEKSSVGGGGGSPDFFRARNSDGNVSHPLHPSAVVLLLAWCDWVSAAPDERAGALLDLCNYAPGEQVSRWHLACVHKGMMPWRILANEAATKGHDCTLCKHLISRTYPDPHGQRWFHWACERGYLLLECGHGTERIWLAPPECESWERWQPAEQAAPAAVRYSGLERLARPEL